MIGMAVGDHRPRNRALGIDMEITLRTIETIGRDPEKIGGFHSREISAPARMSKKEASGTLKPDPCGPGPAWQRRVTNLSVADERRPAESL